MKPSRISQPANATAFRAGAPLLWSATVLLLCELGLQAAQSPNGILADDLGYGDTRFTGDKVLTTPHLDRMASDGIRFTQFYASGPVCFPIGASFLTGRHVNAGKLPSQETTLAHCQTERRPHTVSKKGKANKGAVTQESSVAVNTEESKPNIILIFTDDQGYQDLGCYGSKAIKTPNLDRLAAEGLRLTSFYAQPVCGVSRAALMTGSYPIRVGEPGNIKRLHTVPHPEEITMAEVLKDAGYATALIGKWHLADHLKGAPGKFDPATMPNAQGFDYFYGTPRFNGFTVFVEDTKFRSQIFRNDKIVVEAVERWDHITQDYTREALAWIKQNKSRPFFLYLAHNMPHIPVAASERFKGQSKYGPYGDAIEEIDCSTGQIVKQLKELGLDKNTLLVFTSDNGPWIETTHGMRENGKPFIPRNHSGSAEPLRGWKMSAWDGGSRVPCIIRWPGTIPPGRESDQLLSTMDLLPTFAALAGAALPDRKIDGHDASAFLLGKTRYSPRDTYLYYAGCLLTGVRGGSWKLVLPRPENPNGTGWWGRMIDEVPEIQLYNLADDPGESSNLAAEHPEIVSALMKDIMKAREELGDMDRVGTGARLFDAGERRIQSFVAGKSGKNK